MIAPHPHDHPQARRGPPVRRDDAALGRALVAGDARARDELWTRYAGLVLRVITGVLGPDAEAEDVQHESFLRLLANIQRLRDPRALRWYVVAVAAHTARAERRRRLRTHRLFALSATGELPDVGGPFATADDRWVGKRVSGIVAGLPARERFVLLSRHLAGMRHGEIARALRVSPATVKRALKRATDKVQRRLAAAPAQAAQYT